MAGFLQWGTFVHTSNRVGQEPGGVDQRYYARVDLYIKNRLQAFQVGRHG